MTPPTEVKADAPYPGAQVLALAWDLACDVADAGIPAGLLGGVAVALRCPAARSPSRLARDFSDLDYATTRQARAGLAAVLLAHGFGPVARFNSMNGHRRMLFADAGGLHVDVFVDKFEMCHVLSLSKRLVLGEVTLPLADLLLTKLQVAEVNAKDVGDVVALLSDHPLSADETGINLAYICRLLGEDWGWWRTVTSNLSVVRAMLPTLGLAEEIEGRVLARLDELRATLSATPKSLGWKARALIGDRRAWRQVPEEPVRGVRRFST